MTHTTPSHPTSPTATTTTNWPTSPALPSSSSSLCAAPTPQPAPQIASPPPRNILLCTLGASWAVVAEVFGWLTPATLDLYAHHPQRTTLDVLRAQHGLLAPDELWICTTEGAQTQASLAALHTW